MRRRRVQGALRKAKQRAGITKRDLGMPTLRHGDATHGLEAGVHLRAMQHDMGHAQLATTLMDFHWTQKGHEDAVQRLHTVMQGWRS